MLDLGWTELMLIAGVMVLVISPKDLPRAMRTVGNYVGQMKRMARGFQNQVNDALREAELDDVKKSVEAIGKIDPIGDIKKEVRKVDEDLKKELALPKDPLADGTKDSEKTAASSVSAPKTTPNADGDTISAASTSQTSNSKASGPDNDAAPAIAVEEDKVARPAPSDSGQEAKA